MSRIEALIADFGGVLTTPLIEAFAAVQSDSGVSLEDVGRAMGRVAEQDGRHPCTSWRPGA